MSETHFVQHRNDVAGGALLTRVRLHANYSVRQSIAVKKSRQWLRGLRADTFVAGRCNASDDHVSNAEHSTCEVLWKH